MEALARKRGGAGSRAGKEAIVGLSGASPLLAFGGGEGLVFLGSSSLDGF
jgi:hypothetical protein